MANTALNYEYADADNFKVGGRRVFRGEFRDGDIAWLQQALDEGEFFIPSQVGLEDLQHKLQAFGKGEDHVWHRLEDPALELTEDPADDPRGILEFVAEMTAVTEWDIIAAMDRLGLDF